MSTPRMLSRYAGVLAAFLFSTTAAVFAAPAAVTLKPAAGPPTTTLTVAGTGFDPTQLIDIYFDATDLCLAASGGTGAFSCAIKVPVSAQPQNHWITAAERSSGLAAQKAFTVRTDWGQFHGLNARHTGFNPYENTINTSNIRNLDILWTLPLSNFGTTSTPAVVAGRVYIGDGGGNLYSFSNKTGAAFAGWPITLGGPVLDSSPAVGGNIVYIGTRPPDDAPLIFRPLMVERHLALFR